MKVLSSDKMPSPLVSIIIPAYNSANYLAETIQSAIDQTWPNKEIIVVNDGSTDGTLAIARSFESEIVKVLNQENKGASAARNKGLSIAKGEYIQFLDADDLLSSDKIQNQVEILEKRPGKISTSSTIHFKDSLTGIERPSDYEEQFLSDDDDPVHFLVNLWGGYSNHGSMIAVHSWLTPRIVIDKAGLWNEALTLDDDGEFFCRVVLKSTGILKAAGFNYYRKHTRSSSLSSIKTQKTFEGKYMAFLSKKKYLLAATDDPAAKISLMRSAMDIAVDAYLFDKKLTKKVISTVDELGGTNYLPVIGGKPLEIIKKLLGWKTAMRLKQIYLKLK